MFLLLFLLHGLRESPWARSILDNTSKYRVCLVDGCIAIELSVDLVSSQRFLLSCCCMHTAKAVRACMPLVEQNYLDERRCSGGGLPSTTAFLPG